MTKTKKIEQMRFFLSEQMQLFRCPKCHKSFVQVEKNSFKCELGHTFDISRKGSVFFLIGKAPDDYSKNLFDSRRTVIQHGIFDPVIDYLSKKINNSGLVVDAGSGEGSITELLAHKINNQLLGFDISKNGVDLAVSGKTQSNLHYFVGDLSNIPLADHSVRAIINFLSPANYGEFGRILESDGVVYKIIPNANYLVELRHLKYQTNQKHFNYSNENVVNLFKENFASVESKKFSYKVAVKEISSELMAMTPLMWDAELRTDFEIDQITVDLTS